MTLIGMAVYSTPDNGKDDCLEKTLSSLHKTVDFNRHRLMVSVNSYTGHTSDILTDFEGIISKVIYNSENIGTAEAINKIWKERKLGENAIKMDDDVVIYQSGWVDLMEESIARDKLIGIIGLKRKDLIQATWHPDPQYVSKLHMLPHRLGEKWLIIERTADIIGTCTMYSSALLDCIGYLRQLSQYGYDDSIACHRSHLAGFYNCFLTGIEIDHIDPGGGEYGAWKHADSAKHTSAYIQDIHDMVEGKKSIYYNPFK